MNQIAQELQVIFEEFEEQLVTLTEESMHAIAKETADRIRIEAQIKKGLHDTGAYASGWKVSKRKGKGKISGFVVHNSKKPQLTMLLAYGHIIRNQYGTYGRTLGIPHIKPAEMWSQQEIIRRLGNRLRQIR